MGAMRRVTGLCAAVAGVESIAELFALVGRRACPLRRSEGFIWASTSWLVGRGSR